MSMTAEERRTEVLERQDFPAGSVRWTKASSRYDRRRRHFCVEYLAPEHRGGFNGVHEDWLWRVVYDWPVRDGGRESAAFYRAAWLTVRAMSADDELRR